jgi:type VI protein secretion system component VasF
MEESMLEQINPDFRSSHPTRNRIPHSTDDKKKLHATIWSMALGLAALLVLLILFWGNSAGGLKRPLSPTFAVVDPIE